MGLGRGRERGGEAQSKRRLKPIADRGAGERGERNEEREGKERVKKSDGREESLGMHCGGVTSQMLRAWGRGVRGAKRVRRVRGVGRVWAYIGALYRLFRNGFRV